MVNVKPETKANAYLKQQSAMALRKQARRTQMENLINKYQEEGKPDQAQFWIDYIKELDGQF